MNAEVRHFFETATEQEKRQAKALWNHTTNKTRTEIANAARRQEQGEENEDSDDIRRL